MLLIRRPNGSGKTDEANARVIAKNSADTCHSIASGHCSIYIHLQYPNRRSDPRALHWSLDFGVKDCYGQRTPYELVYGQDRLRPSAPRPSS
ncbi:hypothetical protein F3Y22_tig00111208pilonHSYRG00312 [Hibiscus syriacus]|uniref:Uncharacterized protein n=1 Tax=Hibiscus syriacus TaxID=106335 RepID=A0A6A2YVE5_HIBSY|nr:hypothetical protein F3Y22_tig00111208pilonHSYRG00312 [Hibiscus syriacus]